MNFHNSSITGLVIRDGRIRSITISAWPLLIFDAKSLARAWADKMAAEATAAGVANDPDTAVTLARAGAELISWTRDPTAPTPSWPEINERKRWPLVVRPDSLGRFIDSIWEWSEAQQIDEPDPFTKVDFLLDIDNGLITATRKNRVILRHAGDIRAREVTRVELESRIAMAMIMCAPEWEEPTSEDEETSYDVAVAPKSVHSNREADTTHRLTRALNAAMPHVQVSTETQIGDPRDNIFADLAIPEARLMVEIKNWTGNDGSRQAGEAILAMRPLGWRGILIDGREIEQNLGDVVERIVGLCAG